MNEKPDIALAWLDIRIRKIQRYQGIRNMVWSVLVVVAIVYILFGVVFGIVVVQGSSMEPALYDGDFVLYVRHVSRYSRGDMVIVDVGEEQAVKRMVALPGEQVNIDGQVQVNGTALELPYGEAVTQPKEVCDYPLTLGAGEYFVLGDCRSNSVDSRNYGPVRQTDLCGKVLCVLRLGG